MTKKKNLDYLVFIQFYGLFQLSPEEFLPLTYYYQEKSYQKLKRNPHNERWH